MPPPTHLVTGPSRRDDGSRTVLQDDARQNALYHDRERIRDDQRRRASSANIDSDEEHTDSEEEHPTHHGSAPGARYDRPGPALGVLPPRTSIQRPPPGPGRRGDYDQSTRRSHSPPRLLNHNPRQTDEYTSSRRRPSPPANRPSPSPSIDDSQSSTSSHSGTSRPANAPSPASSSAGRLVASVIGMIRGRNGASRAARPSAGTVPSASAQGPPSQAAHVQLPHAMAPPPPHALAQHAPLHAIPGPAAAHAAPPAHGYAPVGILVSVPLPPLPPGTPVVYGANPHQALAFPGLRLQHPSPSSGIPGPGRQQVLYYCEVPGCNELPFARTVDWESHVKTHYAQGLAFPCFVPSCTRRYKSLRARRGHMKSDHPGVRY